MYWEELPIYMFMRHKVGKTIVPIFFREILFIFTQLGPDLERAKELIEQIITITFTDNKIFKK